MTAPEEPDQPAAPKASFLWPVQDIDAAVDCYAAFGFALRFRDGDRFAAVSNGCVVLSLVAGSEDVTGGEPALALQVPDATVAMRDMVAAGARPLVLPAAGPHEVRAVVRDRAGRALVLHSRIDGPSVDGSS